MRNPRRPQPGSLPHACAPQSRAVTSQVGAHQLGQGPVFCLWRGRKEVPPHLVARSGLATLKSEAGVAPAQSRSRFCSSGLYWRGCWWALNSLIAESSDPHCTEREPGHPQHPIASCRVYVDACDLGLGACACPPQACEAGKQGGCLCCLLAP